MRVLLTGAGGFVGSHLARLLVRDGRETCALVRKASDLSRIADVHSRMQLLRGDIRDLDDLHQPLRSFQPDVCIHLAWYAKPAEYLHSLENVELMGATVRFAAKLAEIGCGRFVGIGTCFEYDTDAGFLSETTQLNPAFLYSAAKAGTYMTLKNLALGDMTMAWARLFYLYGPYEDERRLVPSVVRAVLRAEEARCTRGEQIRDFLHVEDAASALWSIARSSSAGAINVGSGSPVSVAQLVRAIGEIMERPDLIKIGALPYAKGDPHFVCANTNRLHTETGWRPQFSLRDGLKNAIEWWRARAASLPATAVPPRALA